MQLWFAHGTDVTLREQLTTQVILAILCNDLSPGERLPRTRELARRFKLHPNTVSAGYRQLERDGWVEFRRGSGIYVRKRILDEALQSPIALDRLIADLFRSARRIGAPLTLIRSRLRYWLDLQPPDHFLLIEPDEELRRILAFEMERAATLPVQSCDLRSLTDRGPFDGAIPAALPRHVAAVRQAIRPTTDIIMLAIRSVPSSLSLWLPSPSGALIGIASHWPEFLKLAHTFLLAAGFDRDALIFKDARKRNWHRGLHQAAAVVCDTLTAETLPKSCRPIIFSLLADSSLAEITQYEQFVRNPLA